jgi:hypothetical protein
MVGGAAENQENILSSKLSRENVEEGLEARRIRCRQDQIDANPVLRRDRAVQKCFRDPTSDLDRGTARLWSA